MAFATLRRFVDVRLLKRRGLTLEREHNLYRGFLNGPLRSTRALLPFEHVIIDDLLPPEIYNELCAYLAAVKARGVSESPSLNAFYPFKYVTGYLEKYGGYFYPPRFGEHRVMDLFFSVTWNVFIERLMRQPTNEYISTTLHWHTPGNKQGWVHNDYQKVFFHNRNRLTNGMVVQSNTDKVFTGEAVRSVAVLYYLGNAPWIEGNGGETGIFTSPQSPPTALVTPQNNRLLVMKISPSSFHAFMGNTVDRHAIVQWFHVDTSEAIADYGSV